jgi:hypothetical protein
MKLLSEYSENNKRAQVYFSHGYYVVIDAEGKRTNYQSPLDAEAAAESSVLSVVDSGKIVVFPRKGP